MNLKQYFFAFLGVMLALTCFHWVRPRQILNLWASGNELDYVMPTLKNFKPEFSLRGREVVHTYLSPIPKAGEDKSKTKVADKASDDAKAMEPRGKKQKKETAAKDEQGEKKAELSVAVVNNEDKGEKTSETDFLSGNTNSGVAGPGGGAADKERMDYQQWRERLFANPTKEVMNELIRVYLTEAISRKSFYNVLADLLEDSDPSRQRVALYALAATPSYESFSQLVAAGELLKGPEQGMAKRYLEAYANSDFLPVLERGLGSENPAVVTAAARTLIKAIRVAKNNANSAVVQTQNDQNLGRSLRGVAHTAIPKTFERFVPLLRQLQQSNNTATAQAAQDALSQLTGLLSTVALSE